MWDMKILYQASTHPLGKLTARGRGEKLNFKQICCVNTFIELVNQPQP